MWRSIAGAAAPPRPLFQEVSSPPPPKIDESGELKKRMSELEMAHQVAITKTREAAFQDGFRQAREQAAGEVKVTAERLARLVGELALLKRKIRSDAEVELVNLSLAIARRILHRQISIDAEAIHGLVHAALDKLQNREISAVKVAPAAVAAVRDSLELAGVAPAVQVIADTSLRSGDLIFETTLGDLDASIDTQLEEIQRGFADRLALR